MRFELTGDHQDFMSALDSMVASADPVAVNRAWADGDAGPGQKLWQRIADLGVPALLVDEADGGLGATPVELVCAFEILGRHAVPGPWIESAAFLATALTGAERATIAGGAVATVAAPPLTPYALDADVAGACYVALDRSLHRASVAEAMPSVDPSRRLFGLDADEQLTTTPLDRAFDLATLAASAELLGAGERVLADSVTYVKQRTQFGRAIGSYQAIKHQLADVRIALDFARPLVFGAATDPTPRSVSAAKIQCAAAADLASRVGLQVHGAIGYTHEYDLSRWLLRIRALHSAWGTPAFHRDRLLRDLLATREGS